MNVICAKLITGEEIIGKLITDVGKAIEGDAWDVPSGPVVMEDVRIVAIQPMGNGRVGMSFIPYAVANPEAKVKIDLSKFAMSVFPAQPDLKRAYIGENTGIQVATTAQAAAAGIQLAK